MSMYSTLEVDLTPREVLSIEDITLIESKLEGWCGVRDFKEISSTHIHLRVTFNYGLEKIKELMNVLEEYINYEEVSEVGEFSTEEVWAYSYTTVYACRGKLVIVTHEDVGALGFLSVEYSLSDLRGKNSIRYWENESDEEIFLEAFIADFVSIKEKADRALPASP